MFFQLENGICFFKKTPVFCRFLSSNPQKFFIFFENPKNILTFSENPKNVFDIFDNLNLENARKHF